MTQQAYLNGNWIPHNELKIDVADSGFVLGTTVSERLRTFGGRLFEAAAHFQRLHESLRVVGIDGLDLAELQKAAERLAAQNHALLDPEDDLGLTVFVTPGVVDTADGARRPTVGMHTSPLSFSGWAHLYTQGERLIVSSVRQIPSNCWPATLKCRSRMHYFLADREVRQQDSTARALLLDQEGFVAEASTANVLLYIENEGLISPPSESVLSGISLSVLQTLAESKNIKFTRRRILRDELRDADEILLCSTSPCLLPVVSIDSRNVGDGTAGPIWGRLMSAWNARAGLNIIRQAEQFSSR